MFVIVKSVYQIGFVLALLSSGFINAQQTIVEGHVYDDSTNSPLMYAKVFFLGTQTGTTTDSTGYFKLTISDKNIKFDTLSVSYLGYIAQQIPIDRGKEQTIDIHLYTTLFSNFDEVTVIAGENVAWRYIRKLIANKDKNNPDNLDNYSMEQYAKIRFDLNNFTDKIKKNILVRPFDYIWENTQVTEDGVTYLPVLMTERITDHYYSKNPRDEKSIVQGEKTTGLQGRNLIKFTNDLYLTPNIYENYVTILGKSFPSPLNDSYKQNYKFYLEDSIYSEDGSVTYHIRFKPKYQRNLAFTGDMYFDSASYAVTQINLRFDVMANVNFVRSYYINQFYEEVEEGRWMLSESQVVGDFTVLENSSDLTGFFGRKKAEYYNYAINATINPEIFKGVEPEVYADSATLRNEAYWENRRTEQLSDEESGLYDMIARVEDDPAFKLRKNFFYVIGTGYIPLGIIQIANLYTFYNYNDVEQSRMKLGFRTNPKNSFPLNASAYGAYGVKDKKWKYGGSVDYNFAKNAISRIGVSYQNDISQLSRSFNQIPIDHIVSSLSQIGASNSRNYVENFEAFYEQSIVTGFMARLTYFNTIYRPVAGNYFTKLDESGFPYLNDFYRTNGIRATIKFSHLYYDITGSFYDKKDLYREIRKYPDVAFMYEYVDQANFGSSYDYQKLKLSVRQKVDAKKAGFFQYNVEGGMTIGTVPHVSLDMPFANQLLFADEYSFDLMRFMEFAADQYVTVHLSHHFDGLILDLIPLINKLKWRSYIFGKAYFGSISASNNEQRYFFPSETRGISQPYFEVGFGLENIFKIARMDFTWRLTPGMDEYYWFIVKPSFKIGF